MKILVTGGAGFIGSHIVDALVTAGHHVVVVDNLATGSRDNIPAEVTLHEVNIQDSILAKIFAQEQPEIVFHLAAQIDVRKSVADPLADAQENIIGSLNLLEQCRATGVKKVIFSSTGGAIYGDTDVVPTPESHSTDPISPYGIAKLTIEKYLYFYHHVHGLNYTILRYGNVYGPRQNAKGEAGVVSIFCDQILTKNIPIINGDGSQTRDYVYVGDVVAANMAALNSEKNGLYNIGTGIETTVNDLAAHIKSALQSSVEFMHGKAKPGEQQRSCIDASKAKTELNWTPQMTIADGIKKTAEWFSSRP